jgi:hypothetical protein
MIANPQAEYDKASIRHHGRLVKDVLEGAASMDTAQDNDSKGGGTAADAALQNIADAIAIFTQERTKRKGVVAVAHHRGGATKRKNLAPHSPHATRSELQANDPEMDNDTLALRVAEEWVMSSTIRNRYLSRVRSAKRRASDVGHLTRK